MEMSTYQSLQCWTSMSRVTIWGGNGSTNEGGTTTGTNTPLMTSCNKFGGPNHHHSWLCHLQWTLPLATQMWHLFKHPHCHQQLCNWAFLSPPDNTDITDDMLLFNIDQLEPCHYTVDMDQMDSCTGDLCDSSPVISLHPQTPPALAASPQDAQPRNTSNITNRWSTTRRTTPLTTLDEQGFVISKILTQNAHGLRCHARDIDGNLCPQSPHDYTRYEHLIMTMKFKDIDVYFIQETWLEGNVFDETNEYHIFHHNRKKPVITTSVVS